MNSLLLEGKTLQLTIILAIVIILWVIGWSHYLRLIDRAAVINAQATLSVLEKNQHIFYSINGQYARSIEELLEESPKVRESFARSRTDTYWHYTLNISDTACSFTATRAAAPWLPEATTRIIREIRWN